MSALWIGDEALGEEWVIGVWLQQLSSILFYFFGWEGEVEGTLLAEKTFFY